MLLELVMHCGKNFFDRNLQVKYVLEINILIQTS